MSRTFNSLRIFLIFTAFIGGNILFTLPGTGFSNDIYRLIGNESKLEISGRTNIQSWDATVEISDYNIRVAEKENELPLFRLFTVAMPVESIDSGNSRQTSSIHEYLKADEHPEITFELTSKIDITPANGTYKTEAEGILTVAGESRDIKVKGTLESLDDAKIRISGNYEMKMSDFNVERPTALLGTIRARDEMKVSFDLALSPQ